MTAEFILSELRSIGSPEKAAHLSRFFKTGPGQYGEGDRFLGVAVPFTRKIARANKATPFEELRRLLDSPWHEARLCALLILVYRFKERKTTSEERESIVYMNFESFEWMDLSDARALYAHVKGVVDGRPGKPCILLDEVQEVEGWERAVNSFIVDWGADVYVTGSNSRMLSSELATYLAGRYVSIHVMPLSFGEYLLFRGVGESDAATLRSEFRKYLRLGGFPAVHTARYDEATAYKLVYDIYSSVILRDTVQRHGIRNVELLERVIKFVFDNIGNRLNAKNIADYFKSQQRKVDINTVYNYLDALQGAFIIQRVPRYDLKGREQLQANEKYFVSDLSLIYAVMGYKDRQISGALENIVYWEMCRRGYDVFVGKQENREVDFVGLRKNERIYVQVTYRMDTAETAEREFAPLLAIKDHYPKFVVSLDEFWQDNVEGVKHRHIVDFLLDENW